MLEIYLSVFKNCFEFKGRARRKEYWVFILGTLLVSVALGLIDVMLGLYSDEAGLGLLSGLYALIIIIPSIALSVRRLHDTGRSGWWILLSLIPLIGPIVLIVFYVMDSKPGENEYGPNPKEQLHNTVS